MINQFKTILLMVLVCTSCQNKYSGSLIAKPTNKPELTQRNEKKEPTQNYENLSSCLNKEQAETVQKNIWDPSHYSSSNTFDIDKYAIVKEKAQIQNSEQMKGLINFLKEDLSKGLSFVTVYNKLKLDLQNKKHTLTRKLIKERLKGSGRLDNEQSVSNIFNYLEIATKLTGEYYGFALRKAGGDKSNEILAEYTDSYISLGNKIILQEDIKLPQIFFPEACFFNFIVRDTYISQTVSKENGYFSIINSNEYVLEFDILYEDSLHLSRVELYSVVYNGVDKTILKHPSISSSNDLGGVSKYKAIRNMCEDESVKSSNYIEHIGVLHMSNGNKYLMPKISIKWMPDTECASPLSFILK